VEFLKPIELHFINLLVSTINTQNVIADQSTYRAKLLSIEKIAYTGSLQCTSISY
jgi:hypothetical protein